MGIKEELFEKYQKLGNGGKLAVGLGAGAAGGGLKGAFGSLMSDNGTIGSGFVEGAAYGGVGTGMMAGAGVAGAALFATRIWCISRSLCSWYYGSCWRWIRI